MQVCREDLALVGAASGQTRTLARLAVHAMFVGAQIDCQMGRVAWDYEIVLRVVLGERVLEEHEVRVAWNDIDEPRRLGLLCLYCSQILIQTDRWRRRSDRAIEEALQAARARFGLPPASGFVTPPSGASRK